MKLNAYYICNTIYRLGVIAMVLTLCYMFKNAWSLFLLLLLFYNVD